MTTAIIYATHHGTTAKVAKLIAEKSGDAAIDLFNLQQNKSPDISHYDRIIIGGSIHMGTVQKRLKKFCEQNMELLLTKQMGLFLSSMEQEEKGWNEFNLAFPEALRNHSASNALTGYECLIEKMNFIEKMMIKKITGYSQSFSKINNESIETFVNKLNLKK